MSRVTEIRTDLQRDVLLAVLRITRRKIAEERPLTVSTRELSRELGRVGQVVGHSCGQLTDHGLLVRAGRGEYRITVGGIKALKAEVLSGAR